MSDWKSKEKEVIKKHEGFKDHIYQDSEGKDTIGYGHRILPSDPYKKGVHYSKEELSALYDRDFEKHVLETKAAASNKGMEWSSVPDEAKGVLVSMTYQMGRGGCEKFEGMWKAVKDNDFSKAASEMRDSRWHRQTESRSEFLAKRMEGVSPPPPPPRTTSNTTPSSSTTTYSPTSYSYSPPAYTRSYSSSSSGGGGFVDDDYVGWETSGGTRYGVTTNHGKGIGVQVSIPLSCLLQ